jgi:hypothetical protein
MSGHTQGCAILDSVQTTAIYEDESLLRCVVSLK